MRTRPPATALALTGIFLLSISLASPIPAGADVGYDTIALSTVHDDGALVQTFAEAGCFSDPLGDTVRGGALAASPQADLDLFCINYTAAELQVAIRIPQGTDPASDPGWDNFGAGIAYVYTTAGGTSREIQLSTQNSDNQLRYLVLEGSVSPTLVCEGVATFAGGDYSATIPGTCVDGPETIRLTGVSRYGGADGFLDRAPYDGGFVAVPRETPPGADQVTRISGASRVETAIAVSQASFPQGNAGAVLIALADNFPDAVVAAPLAVARRGPVLLTPGASVPDSVLAETNRVLGGSGDVVLLGGTAALAETVRDAFTAAGHTVTRVSGDSRVTTALAVAQAANADPQTIVLAGGGDYPDALLAGATAPSLGGVAVLVDASGIPAAVQQYLDAHPSAGTIAVGQVARQVMPDADGFAAGANPGQTSAFLLDLFQAPTEVVVATYEAFPDGLSGGAYAALRGIPMLLSARDALPASIVDVLQENGPVSQITLLGGRAALSDTVAGQLSAFQG